MEILELKNGSVDVDDVSTYEALRNKLAVIRQRLDCVTNSAFKSEYTSFYLGNVYQHAVENKHYIRLVNVLEDDRSGNRMSMDGELKQDVIDFLTAKFIEQMNQVIKQMNELIK